MSGKLVTMLRKTSTGSGKLFGDASGNTVVCNSSAQRKKTAEKLNPRLLYIRFHMFSHWKVIARAFKLFLSASSLNHNANSMDDVHAVFSAKANRCFRF